MAVCLQGDHGQHNDDGEQDQEFGPGERAALVESGRER